MYYSQPIVNAYPPIPIPPNPCSPSCPSDDCESHTTDDKDSIGGDGYGGDGLGSCIGIRIGVQIIGIASLLLSVILVSVFIMYAVDPTNLHAISDGPLWLSRLFAIIGAILMLIVLILNIFFLIGVYLDKPSFMPPFIFLLPALVFLILVLGVILVLAMMSTAGFNQVMVVVFFIIVLVVVFMYVFYVTSIYYKRLRCTTK